MAARKDIDVSQTPKHITFDTKINYKVGNSGKSEVNEAIPEPKRPVRKWARIGKKKK